MGSVVGGVVAAGVFLATLFGNAIGKANDKAQGALDKTASLSAKVDVISNDVSWIRKLLEEQQKKQLR